jgi:nucleotide-binding universal stress UspA family protein
MEHPIKMGFLSCEWHEERVEAMRGRDRGSDRAILFTALPSLKLTSGRSVTSAYIGVKKISAAWFDGTLRVTSAWGAAKLRGCGRRAAKTRARKRVEDVMTESAKPPLPQALLVAMDFSASARRALDVSLTWCAGGEITALHVVDTDFAARVEARGLGSSAAVIAKLRARAQEEFAWLAQEKGASAFAPMIVEGVPFIEIVKIAKDLEVDLIAMGMRRATRRLDELLFGSTAESVLRTSLCPVLCVP